MGSVWEYTVLISFAAACSEGHGGKVIFVLPLRLEGSKYELCSLSSFIPPYFIVSIDLYKRHLLFQSKNRECSFTIKDNNMAAVSLLCEGNTFCAELWRNGSERGEFLEICSPWTCALASSFAPVGWKMEMKRVLIPEALNGWTVDLVLWYAAQVSDNQCRT